MENQLHLVCIPFELFGTIKRDEKDDLITVNISRMSFQKGLKFRSLVEFWEHLLPAERLMTDVLRQIVRANLPVHSREKLTYNVPYFYGKRRICLIWPASVPGGGFKKGVMLGFCQGNKLNDAHRYLTHGTNKQVFYKIFQSAEEIDLDAIVALLKEAVKTDKEFQ